MFFKDFFFRGRRGFSFRYFGFGYSSVRCKDGFVKIRSLIVWKFWGGVEVWGVLRVLGVLFFRFVVV